MKQVKHVLAMVVFSVTVGCTPVTIPASPSPAITPVILQHTGDTLALVDALIATEFELNFRVQIEAQRSQHQTMLAQLDSTSHRYVISHHNPANERDDLWSIPLAQDGIAIIQHPDNPVTHLSYDDLQQIYRGFITNWQAVDGEDLPVMVYSREAGSALRLEFDRLVMGNQQTTPNSQILASSEQMLARVAANENAIGYIPISLLGDDVATLMVEDTVASIHTLEDSTYPLRMTVYGIGKQPASALYRDLFIWIQNMTDNDFDGRFATLPR